jgi:acetyl-CoA carboxylase biotin carboxyl carrier protein
VQKQAVAAEAPITPTRDSNVQEVTAPLLGTFYRAPKPGAAPFVEVGSMVEADTIVGILEVMKLMNTVRAGVSGRVSEIGARDGALVEFGEILMRVQRAE